MVEKVCSPGLFGVSEPLEFLFADLVLSLLALGVSLVCAGVQTGGSSEWSHCVSASKGASWDLIKMLFGLLLLEVLRARPRWGRPRTRWRDYTSHLACERLWTQEELEGVSGMGFSPSLGASWAKIPLFFDKTIYFRSTEIIPRCPTSWSRCSYFILLISCPHFKDNSSKNWFNSSSSPINNLKHRLW